MATGVSQLPPAKVSVTPMPWKNTPGICGMTARHGGLHLDDHQPRAVWGGLRPDGRDLGETRGSPGLHGAAVKNEVRPKAYNEFEYRAGMG